MPPWFNNKYDQGLDDEILLSFKELKKLMAHFFNIHSLL
jgi:hypothetical protein